MNINLITIEHVPHCTAAKLSHLLQRIINVYMQVGFTVQTILMDNEFEKVKDHVLLAILNTPAASEHIGKIERCIRVIKELSWASSVLFHTHAFHNRCSSTYSSLLLCGSTTFLCLMESPTNWALVSSSFKTNLTTNTTARHHLVHTVRFMRTITTLQTAWRHVGPQKFVLDPWGTYRARTISLAWVWVSLSNNNSLTSFRPWIPLSTGWGLLPRTMVSLLPYFLDWYKAPFDWPDNKSNNDVL